MTSLNRLLWSSRGVASYAITVEDTIWGPITVTVENGEIVAVDVPSFDRAMGAADFPTFRPFTIDSLFREAYDCLLNCNVMYDAVYGYPQIIDFRGFLERGDYVEVTDFQPIVSE